MAKEHITKYTKEELQATLVNIPFNYYKGVGAHLSKTIDAAEAYIDALIEKLPYYKYKVLKSIKTYRETRDTILSVFPEDSDHKLEEQM